MENNVVYQNTEGRFDPQPSMAFHNFYKWWLVVIGTLSLLSAFMTLGSDSGPSFSVSAFFIRDNREITECILLCMFLCKG